MSILAHTDPYIGPCRRNRKFADARDLVLVANRIVIEDIGKAFPFANTADTLVAVTYVNQLSHLCRLGIIFYQCKVFAVTDAEKKSRGGISAFLVDMDTPGVKVTASYDLMVDDRPCEVMFDHVRVPASRLIGKEGEGFRLAQSWINAGRLRHGARSLGVMERCLELAISYAKQRKTFGAPLAQRQAIQWPIIDIHMDAHKLRLMLYHAAWKFDRDEDCRAEAYMVKIFGDERSFWAADRCMQIYGGMGLSKELPIERFFRDQRSMMITEGAIEVLRMALARMIMGLT